MDGFQQHRRAIMSNVQDGTSVRVGLSQGAVKEYTVDLDILPCDVNDAVAKRRGAAPTAPELMKPSESSPLHSTND